MTARALDPAEIQKTLQLLHQRISERFPDSGLAAVCTELITIARVTVWRARMVGRSRFFCAF